MVIALAAVSIGTSLGAQDPAATRKSAAFEVASVRRNTSGTLRQSWDQSPSGLVTLTNMTLRDLVRDAYGLHDQQLLGGPDWFDRDHFDIVAKAPINAAGPLVDAMKRGLLAERFKLATHWEQRDLPVYELVLAHKDGRLGPGLRPRPDCAPGEVRETGDAPCGGILVGPGRVTVRGQGVPRFARDRIVIDKTGLEGNFDVDLEYTPAPGEFPPFGPPPPADAPALPVALQEQLGLRLQPSRARVDVLVVDRAEQPTDEASFDVVSIRQRTPEQRPSGGAIRLMPGGRLQAPSVTVRQLIAAAYDLQNLQIIDAPRWTSETRFDIEATTSAGVTEAQARAMLRTLLAQRFGLVTRAEKRELPLYILRRQEKGTLGPGLQPSGPECRAFTIPKNVPPPPPPPPPTEIDRQTMWLGTSVGRCPVLFITMAASSHMTMRELTMATLARRLTTQLDRLVLDRTGLEGFFDVDLTYVSESQALSGGSEASALIPAIREQLGLRLEATRAPVEVLVIDRVEQPTEN
jgi:uncharacterized protein (TIGR03435 family)